MTNFVILASMLISLGFLATGNAHAQTSSVVREFATRPSISVKAIVTTPEKAVGQVILLPGGGGDIGLSASGQITTPQMADNFTVRTRSMFVDAGYTTIVLDVASDVTNLISPSSRESIAKNRDDVVAIAATLKKESKLPLWIIGTSASSWRLVLMTHRLQSEVGISGIVLTGTVVGKSEMYWKAVEQIAVPVLVVHHRNDACSYSKPEAIQPLLVS
jgi:pimeloyl-ACP methyl ester carboxylesterase